MKEAFIVSGVRTAIGSYAGSLANTRADDLAAFVIKQLVQRTGIEHGAVEDVLFGCANQAGEDNRNIARMASLLAGLPASVPGETVNRLCASGLCSVINGARQIKTGEADLIIAGGVEQMSRAPFVVSKSSQAFARNQEFYDTTMGWRFVNPEMKKNFGTDSMGETAENVATQFKISREDQDKFAFASQMKAKQAQAIGRFKEEIVALEVKVSKGATKSFDNDEFVRPDTSLEVLAKLKPAFKENGTVTAGNSSGINDGACALLLASAEACSKYRLNPIAKVRGATAVGVEPRIMGIGPVEASKQVLSRCKLKISDLGVIELNEAFAAQSLACLRLLGLTDNDPRVNPNGGAIALGHPLGMSGARLALTTAIELQKKNAAYGLATMCVGVGQGVALILERV